MSNHVPMVKMLLTHGAMENPVCKWSFCYFAYPFPGVAVLTDLPYMSADLLLFIPISRHLPSSSPPHPSPKIFFGLPLFCWPLTLPSSIHFSSVIITCIYCIRVCCFVLSCVANGQINLQVILFLSYIHQGSPWKVTHSGPMLIPHLPLPQLCRIFFFQWYRQQIDETSVSSERLEQSWVNRIITELPHVALVAFEPSSSDCYSDTLPTEVTCTFDVV